MEDVYNKIQKIIDSNEVVLFMKGTADMPCCGFSGVVVDALKKMQVNFIGVNVLEDDNLREGIKTFSKWPTIPQLYVKGEFIGGSDIVEEMRASGELEDLFKRHKVT